MDFVILKVNGQDVSNSSHEEAVRCFQSAQEPILVEVLRRYPAAAAATAAAAEEPRRGPDESEEPSRGDGAEEKTFTLLVSTGVQTEWAGLVDEEDLLPVRLHADEQTCNDSFDDMLGPEIDFEEVTLRRSGSAEKLGLTVCYSSAGSGSEDADTEVYISEIVPESLAARDGRLREGDQILRVNGKDVASKEQTESLFAETESDVTILVSRCLYTDDDEDESRAYPAYQNSMIEQLIRQQQQQQQDGDEAAKDSEPTSEAPPPVPSHVQLAFSEPSSTCSSQKSSGCGPDIAEQQRKKWMQEALKECARRVDNIKLGATPSPQQQHKSAVKLAEAYSSHVWSDTEHIYETIPESDSEPIYSSPYEHRHWPYEPGNNQQSCPAARQQPGQPKPSWHCSSKSNSSGEEKDSSSAYNTGESCNSNTLTLELQQPSEHHRSTLVLCPPTASAACSCPVPLAPPPAKCAGGKLQQVARRGPPVPAAETMYTNAANLQQTMRLQQQLFKQALSSRRKSGVVRDAWYARRSRAQTAAFQAPSLAQYRFVASHQVSGPTAPFASSPQQQQQQQQQQRPQQQQQRQLLLQEPVQMEWKVKRRPDGSRYITRRPVRNRILRNRALRINEERQGHTTEDDAVSEIKVGRYWSKEERKRQLERAKERKQRQQELLQQQQQQQQQSSEQLIYDYSEDSKTLKNSPNSLVEQAQKKAARKKPPADDFATVQEILVHGNRVGSATQNSAGKLMGLLSVTTV
ncbi:E3 ubiquitin-protein ligase PDZRN3 [Nasonia vitripennis]|uniref:PDZ domain-containing protein n=1 Tax=Nasonia vitripennis TaxID=7425 RepID=A0A7M7G3H0_NASVI|nr:E3 ubiquitin-protein ligase PDZRN3 [Nasonia vitripennis]